MLDDNTAYGWVAYRRCCEADREFKIKKKLLH